ncbi:MAG: TolC family protein [Crocinitomicaceae bacterium]
MKRSLSIFLICFSWISFGQEDLTVFGAIEKALTNNYQVRLVEGNYQASKLQNSWGQAGLIPTFSLSLSNSASLQDNSNNPATFFPGVLFTDNLTPSLDMNWTVFNGFGIRINKQRFEQLQEQTKGNAIVVIESTIYDVILAYYTTVVQQRKLEVMEGLLVYSQDKLEYYKIKEEMGISTSIDLLEFENQVLTDSTNLLLQQLSVRNSKRNLNLIMAEDVDVDYNLTDSLSISAPNLTYEELQQKMIADNQNLKNQYMNLELKELDIKTKRSAMYPIVTLSLGTSPSVGYFRLFGDNGFDQSTNSWTHRGNISIKYDLFQGMNRKRNIQIAEIQRDMANIEIDELKLNLSHQLRGNYELYQTRTAVENMSFRRVEHARKLWKIGKERYDLGLINVFNLNDIKLSYEQAVLNYYDRLFELIQTHYDLLRMTGQISQQFKIEENFDPSND